MNRVKNFDATGIAPNGILFSGDLNAIQDAAAALTDYSQTHAVGALAVGESGLQLLHFGSGEARVSGALRTDGIFRGLGGLYGGAFTTTQRNTIASGFRPYGLILTNTTTNQLEWNSNTDASPTWYSIASDGLGYINTQNGVTFGADTTLHRTGANTLQLGTATQAGTLQIGSTAQPGLLSLYGQTLTGIRLQFFNGTDTQPTFTQLTNGTHNWGPGGSTPTDTSASRTAPGILTFTNTVNAITGFQIGGTALAASHLSNGVTGTGAIVLASGPTFTAVPNSISPPTVDNSTKVATTAWVIAQGYVSTTGISVSSVFGRTGAITAQVGDYTAALITNAADKAAAGIQTFTANVGAGGAPTAVGGATGTSILSTGGVVASRAAGGTILSGTVPGDTVYRFMIDNNGLYSWSTGLAASDTTMGRTAAGVLTVTSYVNAVNGFQINGVALAASHLSNGVSGSGAVALITSPSLVGTPTAPTAATTVNTQQIATTAFVNSFHVAQAGTITPAMDGTSAVGTSTLFARQDHIHPTDTTRAALAGGTFTGAVTIPTLTVSGTLNATNYQRSGVALAASHLSNGVSGSGAVILQVNPTISGTLTISGSALINTFTGGIGYTTGSGASGTTSNAVPSTGTLSRPTGVLTSGTSVAALDSMYYTISNTLVDANDTIIVNLANGTALTPYQINVTSVGTSTFSFTFYNAGGVITPRFNYTIIKGSGS